MTADLLRRVMNRILNKHIDLKGPSNVPLEGDEEKVKLINLDGVWTVLNVPPETHEVLAREDHPVWDLSHRFIWKGEMDADGKRVFTSNSRFGRENSGPTCPESWHEV